MSVDIATGGGGTQSWTAVLGGSADFSIQDPVFVPKSHENGGPGVVVAAIQNAPVGVRHRPRRRRRHAERPVGVRGQEGGGEPGTRHQLGLHEVPDRPEGPEGRHHGQRRARQ